MEKTTTKELDEKELIKGLKQGQERAFSRLVHRYRDRLTRVAYGIVLEQEESLEIVQDVFVSVYKNIDSFRGESGLSTWLVRITINLSLNWKRRWKRRFRWGHHSLDSQAFVKATEKRVETPEAQYRGKELEARTMDAVAKLPEKTRAVFVLNTLEGLSYGEIAQALDIKIGTVKSRLFQARKSLSKAVGEGT
ncbi:MAG: sigma-70 family RNA polymerase sigma factor [Desulfobacterium sp.]|nr:sigma-70 family RNA polymerase sigma factor [Desulfobacterium sp.]